jgi:hypothetical protein
MIYKTKMKIIYINRPEFAFNTLTIRIRNAKEIYQIENKLLFVIKNILESIMLEKETYVICNINKKMKYLFRFKGPYIFTSLRVNS